MTQQTKPHRDPEALKDTPETMAANMHDTGAASQADDKDANQDVAPAKPEKSHGLFSGFNNWIKKSRRASIEATPAFIVNNSSNVLGASHVATEMLMFKSGLKGSKLIDNPSNPINWIKEPAQKIGADIFKNSKTRDFSIGEIFHGNPVQNVKRMLFDTHAASLREVESQIKANSELVSLGKQATKISLGNPWQTRTTGTGLFIWTVSTILPEHKESDDEIERMAKLRTLNPLGYVGERLKQAVWFPQWPSHKREMLGLGYLGIGTFSMLGAWRNRGELNPAVIKDMELIGKGLTQGYKFNLAYFATGAISFIGGLPLLFALDERAAYSSYGSMVVARVPLLPASIGAKIAKKEEGWLYYLIGKVTFQIEDMLFSLIGGATKRVRPDGSIEIVDHDELKKKSIAEAKEEKIEAKEHHQEQVSPMGMEHGHNDRHAHSKAVPSTLVSGGGTVQHAMPARAEAKQQEMTEVRV
mgnify:CR=1 FL=1